MAYIGTTPIDVRSFGTVKFEFTATSGQTAFTGTDDNNKTLSFVDDQLEVYVNGVLMDNDDFSTSGGNTVTLASAAAANDIITVNTLKSNAPITDYVQTSGGTFTGGINVSSGRVGIGTSSPNSALETVGNDGITISNSGDTFLQLKTTGSTATNYIEFKDSGGASGAFYYNHTGNYLATKVNGSERMRIDSSGNLLVGKTSSNTGSLGAEFRQDGLGVFGRSSDYPLILNRTTSDGGILLFRKDSTTVGSIGSVASGANLYMSAASGIGLGIGGDNLYPVNASGASTDGSLDIGDSTARFKDLYLSGTARISGTQVSTYTVSGISGGSVDTSGGDTVTGRIFFTGQADSGTDLFGINNESTGLAIYNYTDGHYGIYLNTSNNVGIGTSSPSEELHIYDSGNDPYVLVDGSGGNRDSGYKINAGNGVKIMARADSSGSMFFNDNSISIKGQIGNGGYRSHIFDSEIQVGGQIGATNPARVVVARVIEPKDLSLTSTWTAVGGQTDTVSGTAYVRTSSQSSNTAFFGPYGLFPPGSYTALFRIKVASNSSTSGMGFIDVSGGAVRDPVGSNPRARLYNLSPSSFGASNVYQYFALDFECHSNSGQIEFRWINWVSGLTDTYLDHILVVPRLNHN